MALLSMRLCLCEEESGGMCDCDTKYLEWALLVKMYVYEKNERRVKK